MTIEGRREDENVYNNLRAGLQNVENTVVINRWTDKTPGGMMVKGEYDFLIVSQPLRTIFHIEVKRTWSEKSFEKAAKMLDSGLKTIQNNIQFPEEEKWNYAKMIYFGRADTKHAVCCPECQKFVLGPTNDIWAEITKTIEKPAQSKSSNKTYLDVLKFLLYEMYKQENTTDQHQLIKETQKTSDVMTTTNDIFFWSKAQLKVVKATKDIKRVALTSEFGTGKTIMLQAKAREILDTGDPKEGERGKGKGKSRLNKNKVVIVIFEGKFPDTFMKMVYQQQFPGAKIIGIQGLEGNSNVVQWKPLNVIMGNAFSPSLLSHCLGPIY